MVGKVFTVPQLTEEMGYDAVFIGTGAGSPKFMNIPGESNNGVFSANEFLTRVNLMRGNERPLYDTPVGMGRRAADGIVKHLGLDEPAETDDDLMVGREEAHAVNLPEMS